MRGSSLRTAARVALLVGSVFGCRESPGRVTIHNPLHPFPVSVEVGGRAGVDVGAGAELPWTAGEPIVATYDIGCGTERVSLAALPGVDAWSSVRWIDVTVDNREGPGTTLGIGTRTVTVAENATPKVRAPAATCDAGARVRVGDRDLGTLPLADAPAMAALVDVRGDRCYRLLGGPWPEGDVLLGRSVYAVPRIDELGAAGGVAAEGRFVLRDEPCIVAQVEPAVASTGSAAAKKKKTASVARPGKDPVGDAVEALTERVNACVVSSMSGNQWSVQIRANVVVNLRGQLLEAQVYVTPPSESLRGCVTRLIRATKFPKNDVPLTTVKKNWRVQMVP